MGKVMKKNEGFTLQELIVVVVIIGIMASTMAVSVSYFMSKSAESIEASLARALDCARLQSMMYDNVVVEIDIRGTTTYATVYRSYGDSTVEAYKEYTIGKLSVPLSISVDGTLSTIPYTTGGPGALQVKFNGAKGEYEGVYETTTAKSNALGTTCLTATSHTDVYFVVANAEEQLHMAWDTGRSYLE